MLDTLSLKRLERPRSTIDVVLDTDAYNEIDDQFAISWLLKAEERVHLKALYAAPFHNHKSSGPADGMEKSYQEILHLLNLAGRDDMQPLTYRGSGEFLTDEKTPVLSPAARDLAYRAMAYTPENPLYVLAIGAITNVASALLLQPEIKDRIVIVWLGGHALHWPNNREFNLRQDVAAARVVMGCGAALVLLPCLGVVDMLRTTKPELEHWLKGKNQLCDYLFEHTAAEADSYALNKPWSRVIWDIATVAWLLDTDCKWCKDKLIPSPIPQYDHHFSEDFTRPFISYVWNIDRDAVFEALFQALTK